MAIVKLALSGLAGVEQTHVALGSATVVYDAQQQSASGLVAAVNAKTPFRATLRDDRVLPPSGASPKSETQ